MFRKIFSVLFTILIIASILTGNFSCFVKAEHGKWIVDDDGVADFQSIQDAVDVACEGDIIFVKRGLYRESLRIYKSLSLIGEDMETTIVEANVTKFEYGVTITASNVSFTGFTIRNAAIAIAIWGGYGNLITYNTIIDNNVGLQFFYSNSNVIYHNNFIYNFIQLESIDSSNIWDNGCEGNFWSDYAGLDDGSNERIAGDGVGDTLIPHRGVDNYPLMEPWNEKRIFPLKWGGQVYYIMVLSNSTVASFNFNQPNKKLSFKVTGPSGTVGFCNVTIPKNLLNGDFCVLIDGLQSSYMMEQNETHSIIGFTYLHSAHLVEIIGEYSVGPKVPEPSAKPRRFRLLAVEQMFDSERMKSAQNLIKTLLRYPNWNNSTDEYVSFIHLLSMYGQNELDDSVKIFWQGSPSFDSIKNEMENFLAQASPGEIVIFYYVGHTYVYLEPSHGLVYRFCGVSLKELKEWLSLGGLPQAYVVLILDTCYSGYWTKGVLSDSTVLAACKQSQSAWGHMFDGHFTVGILGSFWMAEDLNNDGWVSAAEAFKHAKEYVETHFYEEDEAFKQNPQGYFPVLDGDVPIVLRDIVKEFPLWDTGIVSIQLEDVERVEPGVPIFVNVTIENQGDKVATVNLDVFCDGCLIGYSKLTIQSSQNVTMLFVWNTAGFYGLYLNFTAIASCSPGELDLADNFYQINKAIRIAVNTDCNVDGVVDVSDIFFAAYSFGTSPGHVRWRFDADVNRDGYVGIDDIWLIAREFGRICFP